MYYRWDFLTNIDIWALKFEVHLYSAMFWGLCFFNLQIIIWLFEWLRHNTATQTVIRMFFAGKLCLSCQSLNVWNLKVSSSLLSIIMYMHFENSKFEHYSFWYCYILTHPWSLRSQDRMCVFCGPYATNNNRAT
mgnify:CR=1 FL=1